MPDFNLLSRNLAQMIGEGGKVLAAYFKPLENGDFGQPGEDIARMAATLGRIAEYYLSDAQRALAAQAALSRQFLDLWASTLRRLQGEAAAPVAAPDPGDKRFDHPEWRDNPYFDFLKQAYVLTTRWAKDLVARADELDPETRQKAQFYLRQLTSALSPSNFVPTNPELLRTTLAESGENLVRGLKMMAEDIAAGGGNLRIRHSDASKFTLGVNLAATPGKVIYRNDLIELIQYAPTTETVFKRPLLIVPPWINKFYVLDLNPEKSFIAWALAQGLTVFVVSWVNPDERHADKGFESLHARRRVRGARRDRAGDRRARRRGDRLLRRRHAAGDRAWAPWRRPATSGSPARRCWRRRSTSPTPATSRCSSTPNSSRRSNARWRRPAASSKARRWPTPSTCCGPTS